MTRLFRYLIKGFHLIPVVIRDLRSLSTGESEAAGSKPYIIVKSGTFKNKGDQVQGKHAQVLDNL